MAINFTIQNLLTIVSALYPLFIVSFLVLASIFNMTPLKGLTYLGGIITSYIIWALVARLWNKTRDRNAPHSCSLFNLYGNYKWPSVDVIITFFTFVYLIIPMFEFNHQINWVVLSILLILNVMHMVFQCDKKCSDLPGVILGLVFGSLFGLGWWAIFWSSGNKHLLFYNELVSNNAVCNKPAKQTFKCSVYRNGEIISSSLA